MRSLETKPIQPERKQNLNLHECSSLLRWRPKYRSLETKATKAERKQDQDRNEGCDLVEMKDTETEQNQKPDSDAVKAFLQQRWPLATTLTEEAIYAGHSESCYRMKDVSTDFSEALLPRERCGAPVCLFANHEELYSFWEQKWKTISSNHLFITTLLDGDCGLPSQTTKLINGYSSITKKQFYSHDIRLSAEARKNVVSPFSRLQVKQQ